MTFEFTDDNGVRTIVEDETLAEALRNELPERPIAWRTIDDEWNADGTVRRIIRAEIAPRRHP